jgi:hypothetical protein
VSAESICLEVGSHGFEIFIDLICSDEDSSSEGVRCTDGFEEIHSTHDIGLKCPDRIAIALTNKWLSRKMKDDFWFIFVTYRFEALEIIDICIDLRDIFFEFEHVKEIGLGTRRERVADHTCTERVEPEGKPRSLKSCGTCDEDGFSVIKMRHKN